MNAVTLTPTRTKTARWKPILVAALTVGILDISAAMLAWGIARGISPIRILQSIASGWYGKAAFQGGARTATIGFVSHFAIALCVAAMYYFASRKLPLLTRHAVPCGLVYGELVYLVMNFVVMPLSAIHGHPPLTVQGLITGPIGHPFLVGLPTALITRTFSRQ